MNKILYSPKEGTTGFCGIRGLPEEPNWNLTSLSNDVKKRKWRETLESCKSNKLEIVNPEEAAIKDDAGIWFVTNWPHNSVGVHNLKPGDIFDPPQGFQFKEEEKSDGWMGLTKVLRLVK